MSDRELKGERLKIVMAMIDNIIREALFIPVEDASGLVNAINLAESIGPIVDPTGYREHMDQGRVNHEMARAFLAFRNEIERIRERAEKRRLT